MGEQTTLEVVIAGKDQFSATANKVNGSLKNLERTAGQIGGHMAKGFRTAGQNLERMAFAGAALAVGGGALAVKWAGDFQAQLNTINTIAFATPDALNKIGDQIRQVAKDTGVSLDDLTSAYYDLLSAGVKTADAQSLLNNAVTLGIGGLADTKQTVDLLTTAYNAYGLTAKGATVATDQFAQAVADGKVTAAQIAESFANVASIAKVAHVGIDQIAASYAFLTAQGVPAAEVTTEMQRAIISLMKPLPALKAAQDKLKVNFLDDVSKKGLIPALQELRDYSDKNKVPLIELLGRVEAVKYVLQTTGPNEKGFANELLRIRDSAGEAAKQMAERQQGFNYQLAVLKANVKDAGITIGTELLPVLGDLAKEFADFLRGHQGDVKSFAKDLAQAVRDAVKWGRSLDWKSIGDSLKTAASFAKGLVDAFLAAPTWLQEAVVTGWGLNKLTGGALTNIFGDVARGIGGQFFTRGSSPANPMWVTSVGGGLGGPGGGGLGPAGLLGAAGIVVAAQGIANSMIPNGGNAYNVPTTPSGFGPNLIDPSAAHANAAAHGGTLIDMILGGTSMGNSPPGTGPGSKASILAGGGSAASRGGYTSDAVQALRANTAALLMHLRAYDKAWLATLPKGIHDRSAAKYGHGGLGAGAESATYQRDVIRRADGIVRGHADANKRLARLQELMKDSTKATQATKDRLSKDIKAVQAQVAAQNIKVNVSASTSIILNGRKVAQANASLNAYGRTDPKSPTGQIL